LVGWLVGGLIGLLAGSLVGNNGDDGYVNECNDGVDEGRNYCNDGQVMMMIHDSSISNDDNIDDDHNISSYFSRYLQTFFQEKKHLRKCSKYVRKLSRAFVEWNQFLMGEEKIKVEGSYRDVELLWETYSSDCSNKQKLLDDLNKKWNTYETLLQSLDTWMQEAERLIEKSKLSVCKVNIKYYVVFVRQHAGL